MGKWRKKQEIEREKKGEYERNNKKIIIYEEDGKEIQKFLLKKENNKE